MPTLRSLLLLAALPLLAAPPLPDTPRRPVADTYQGVRVSEDYRWLEASGDPAVKAWSAAQNDRSRAYLDGLPGRAALKARIEGLIRGESVDYQVEAVRAGLLFAYRIDPRKQQPALVTLSSTDAARSERVLLDPNILDASGAVAMDWFVVSPDGRRVGVSLSRGGSEAGDLHLFDAASGQPVGEIIPHVQNGTAGGSMAFNADASGFWYTRYPRGGERPAADAAFYQQIWFHRIGTATEADTCELGAGLPKVAECLLQTKADGRWVLAEIKNGDGGEVAFRIRRTEPGSAWIPLSGFRDRITKAAFGTDDSLWLLSLKQAPRGRLLRLDLAGTPALARARTVVPPSDGAIESFLPTASRLYVQDVLGGPSRIRVFTLEGRRLKDLPILPVSWAGAMVPLGGDDLLFRNDSFTVPAATWSLRSGVLARTALARTSPADFGDVEVLRRTVPGRDGTPIPVTILKRRGTALDGQSPLLLYAYGGFGVSEVPGFSPLRRIWLDRGGLWAVANIRGGAEFGDPWHQAGRLLKKQNCFDDFHACARWLIDNHFTSPARLAIMGGSNGGLLMGAVLTQHPDLCRAVVSEVGIYDMLRNELTPNGVFNVLEYGSVRDPAQFRALYGYSPLHHVRDGAAYPAVLLTTGANDPRVEPWQSRKFCARLQAASSSGRPVFLRTSENAGHGIGSSLDETIAEATDIYGFLMDQLGMH